MWTNRNFTNVFTCPFLIIYAFWHNLQTFFISMIVSRYLCFLKNIHNKQFTYNIRFLYNISARIYETKCMNFSYIVTIKVIKKIILVFVTAINSAVFKSYYTKHHLFFELLSNVHNFVAMELAPWLWQFLRDQVYDSQPFSGSLLRKVNFY